MLHSINRASLDWMPKNVWGPIKWKELHYRGLIDLPMDDEKEWFDNFCEALPCPHCREHFAAFVKKKAPDLTSRENFFAWTVAAHNAVNQATGKAQLSVDEARQLHWVEPE
jgi:hypothetical protein